MPASIIRSDTLTGEDEMDRVSGFRVRAIEKQVEARDMSINETRRFESRLDRVQIRTQDKDLHILREPHGRLINAPHPGRDRVAADDGVGDSRVLERRRRAVTGS